MATVIVPAASSDNGTCCVHASLQLQYLTASCHGAMAVKVLLPYSCTAPWIQADEFGAAPLLTGAVLTNHWYA
jgi:hypothetical protein